MKFHLRHVRIARSYGFPRYVILAPFHSIRTDFVRSSRNIHQPAKPCLSFINFIENQKIDQLPRIARAQNTLRRVTLFRNLLEKNYFSPTIRRSIIDQSNQRSKSKDRSTIAHRKSAKYVLELFLETCFSRKKLLFVYNSKRKEKKRKRN